MRIDHTLQLNQDYYLNSKKDKAKKAEELKETAWKCLQKGYISAFDYITICRRNELLSF